MKSKEISNKLLWFFLKRSGFGYLYINYLWKNRIELKDEWNHNEQIKRVGLIEKGYPLQEIKSDQELFPSQFPIDNLKNTGAPYYQFQDKYVYEISDARLAGPYALGISHDGRVIRDMIAFKDGRFHIFLKGSLRQAPSLMLNSLAPFKQYVNGRIQKKFGTVCVLHSAWNNYFHWITEHLPKLQVLEYYKEKTDCNVTIVIPPDSADFVYETLGCFGIEDQDIYEWHTGLAVVSHLIVPTFPEMTHKTAEWLKKNIYNSLNLVPGERKKRIYISRNDANVRRISNEDELLDFIKPYGFSPYFLSELSFKEQVHLFSEAEIVLAPHGAGLTNILWSENLKIIEIFGSTLKQTFAYSRLADACNHMYHAVVSDPDEIDSTNIKVSVKDIERVFQNLEIKPTVAS